jgi:4-carboxymuconolactone decarboxylase
MGACHERSGARWGSLVTVAALVALGKSEELPAHLHRAVSNGITRTELSGLITHLAFYAGFPAAIAASAIAHEALSQERNEET